MDNAKSGICYWRASVASETLTGVTQLKIRDVCLLSSERSDKTLGRKKHASVIVKIQLTGHVLKKINLHKISQNISQILNMDFNLLLLVKHMILLQPRKLLYRLSIMDVIIG